jgi:hypothetical protein
MRRGLSAAGVCALVCAASLGLGGCFGNSSSKGDAGADFDGSFPDGLSFADGSGASGMLTTTPVDFGMVSCGTAPATKTYSMQNTGSVAFTWSATTSSIFAIQGPSSGSVDPGATGTLTVGASTIPTTSDPGTPITGTLTVTTDIPGTTTVQVPLTVTPQGGSLVLSSSTVGFGTVELMTGSTLPFTLENVGNMPVTVTLGAPTDGEFAVTYTGAPAGGSIAPGGTLAGGSATFTPTSAGAKTATAAIQTTDPLCASAATSIALSGTGSTAPVSIGPSPLDFGTPLCGQAATAQVVTIKNGYTSAITFTAALTLGASSPYALDASSGSVPASGQTTITVTPAAIPVPGNLTAGAYDDTLTVTTTAPGAMPTVIPLQESATGAILELTMASTAFGTVTNTTGTLPFSVTNTGNVDATISVATTGVGFSANVSNTPIVNGAAAPGNATFTPKTNGNASGTLSVSTTTALCAALPAALTLTATGAVPVASFPTGALLVSATCGGGAATTATLVVQNTGNAPMTLGVGPSPKGYFTIQSAPSTIPAGQSGNIVLQGATPAGSLGGTPYADTLSFGTNEPGTPTHTVPVTDTGHGANLSLSVSAIALSDCADHGYSVLNTGDRAATVTANAPYPGAFQNWFADGPPPFGAPAFCNANDVVVPVSIPAGGSVPDGIDADLSEACPSSLPNLSFSAPASAGNPVCVDQLVPGIVVTATGAACICAD